LGCYIFESIKYLVHFSIYYLLLLLLDYFNKLKYFNLVDSRKKIRFY